MKYGKRLNPAVVWVGVDGEFGKFTYFQEHVVGKFSWPCNCGAPVKLDVRIEDRIGARFNISHRSASRVYTSFDPDGVEVVKRIEAVSQFQWCAIPWGSF